MLVELDECYNLLGRNNRELDYLNSRLKYMQKSLHDLTRKYDMANQRNEAHIAATASLVIESSKNCGCCSRVVEVPMPSSIPNLNNTEVCPAHSISEHTTPAPEPLSAHSISEHITPSPETLLDEPVSEHITSLLQVPLIAHSVTENKIPPFPETLTLSVAASDPGEDTGSLAKSPESTNRTVVFSDKVGVGMGSLLNNCLAQPVLNNSYSNLPIKELLKKIKNNVYDHKSTIIVQLGNSLDIKKSDIISLVEILLDIQSTGISKIITCSLPY